MATIPKALTRSGGFTPSAAANSRPPTPIEEFEETAVENDPGWVAMGPFDPNRNRLTKLGLPSAVNHGERTVAPKKMRLHNFSSHLFLRFS
jgi:hypothetical protein